MIEGNYFPEIVIIENTFLQIIFGKNLTVAFATVAIVWIRPWLWWCYVQYFCHDIF